MAQLEMYEGTVSRVSDRNAGGIQLQGYDGWFNVSQYAKPAPELPVVGDFVSIGANNKGFIESIEILQEGGGARRAAPRQQQAPQQQRQQSSGGQQRQQAPGNQQGAQRAATPPSTPPSTPSELPLPIRLRAMAAELAVQYAASRPESKSEHIVPLAKRIEIYLKTGEAPSNGNQQERPQNGRAPQQQPEQPPGDPVPVS